MKWKSLALAGCFLLAAMSGVRADAAREAAAERLFVVMRMAEKTRALYSQQMAEIMGRIQQQRPDMSGRAFDIIEDEFDAITPDLVAEMMVEARGMYAERFTAAEMDAIADFYATAVGQKALNEMQALSLERAAKGREIGARLGQVAVERAIERIKAEGIDMTPKGGR